MIRSMLWLGWINLKRDRVALFLTFLLPLVFFSIFAAIFGGLGGDGGGASFKALRVLAVDEDGSLASGRLLTALAGQDGLEVVAEPPAEEAEGAAAPATAWTRDAAFREVRGGRAAAAVVVPAGFGGRFANFTDPAAVEVIYDASNPMAQYTIGGLLQAAAFQAAPDLLMERGFEALTAFGGGEVSEAQRSALSALKTQIEQGMESGEAEEGDSGGTGGFQGLVSVEATAAHDDSEDSGSKFSMVAYYAAGIGVMFLLFSMTGAAGTLLDDQDSGTLERLLSSSLSVPQLLAGRWLFFALTGFFQVLLMFVWGAIAFGLELFTLKRLAGLGLMAAVTAAAAAAFALLLATLCKSRAQLGGLSTIVILVMSALGGSMVPRFVMPDFMDSLSKATFNGWALDGFLKVFWYDDPAAGLLASLVDLMPQVLVLGSAAVVFLFAARRLARRWERT